jgi:hypothetical protein
MKYYFFCPWYVTGGPEAIHQACSEMNNLGCDAYIVYDNGNQQVISNYSKYNVKISKKPDDVDTNVIVIPESYQPISKNEYKNAKLAYYWLSKDYAVNQRFMTHPNFLNMEWHLCQSKYVFDYLINDLKINPNKVVMFTDYTRDIFVESEETLNKTIKFRNNVVLFNPQKGYEYTQHILNICSNIPIEFIPLRGMTPEQIKHIAMHSKIYIDFGHHPGKDRIPREAVASGCTLIVGNRGSASVYEDVPIMDYRKININNFYDNIDYIKNLIVNDITNYEKSFGELLNYRDEIRVEKETFKEEILNFIKKLENK